jgi:hypothetical protein
MLELGSAPLFSRAYLCGTHREAQVTLFTSIIAPAGKTITPGFVTRGIDTFHLSPE